MKKWKGWILFIGFVAIIVILGSSFFPIWRHKADSGAQAYGAFLSYVVTAITAVVTLVYVYLTRESLKVARAANELQREQWDQRVIVKPKFWLETTVDAVLEFPTISNEARYRSLRYKAIEMVIWNNSEQSFLVHSTQFDIYTNTGRRTKVVHVSQVMKPHETFRKDVSYELLNLFTNDALFAPSALEENLPKARFTLDWSIRYTDWQAINKESDRSFDQVLAVYKIEGTGEHTHPQLNILIERDLRKCL